MALTAFIWYPIQIGNEKPPMTKKNANLSVEPDTQVIMDSIRRIVRSLRHASKTAEKELNLSTAQLFVLQKISESGKPLSINELALKTLTHQSSVSVVVNKLVKKKLVKRVTSKVDARVVEICLNDSGKKLLLGTPPLIQERLVSAVSTMTLSQRRGLRIGLESLLKQAGIQDEEASLFFEEGKQL